MSRPKDPECIFCKIIAGEIPCFKLYEDDNALAFADINPVNEGHCLVIPKGHYENLFEMDPEALAGVHLASQKVAAALKETLGWPGLTMVQLNGRAANQLVMHYHLHLIPRDREKDGLESFDWESVPGDMEEIKVAAQKISKCLERK